MSAPGYSVEPNNKYFQAVVAIAAYEFRPGNTVSFAAEVDLTEVERVRGSTAEGPKPSYTSFVVKAVALALREFPYANRRVYRRPWFLSFGGRSRIVKFHDCDVAVAVERDLPGSEMLAFIDMVRDADVVPLAAITGQLHALATCDVTTNRQWREFSDVITRFPVWLSALLVRLPCVLPRFWVRYRGGAVLVSSPAKYGVDMVLSTWSHPLGVSFGLVKPRPVVRDGEVVARTTFTLTLNFDRRVMAGAQAARFFRRVVERLERAETEMAPFLAPVAAAAAAVQEA